MEFLLEQILFLEKVDIFRNLSLDDLGQIAGITDTQHYREGELLFLKGDPGNFAYIIVSGEVELFTGGGSVKREVVGRLYDGACFGEMALLDGRPRSAGAVVLVDSMLSRIPREDFIRLMHRFPSIAMGIITLLSNRLRRTTEEYNSFRAAVRSFPEAYQAATSAAGGGAE